jgi:hypothetical protein
MCADEGVGVRAPGDELVNGPRPKNVSAVFLRTEVGVSQIGPQSNPITQCWAALRGTLIRLFCHTDGGRLDPSLDPPNTFTGRSDALKTCSNRSADLDAFLSVNAQLN